MRLKVNKCSECDQVQQVYEGRGDKTLAGRVKIVESFGGCAREEADEQEGSTNDVKEYTDKRKHRNDQLSVLNIKI